MKLTSLHSHGLGSRAADTWERELTMDLRQRFGNLVAAHRRRRGLTQQMLADLTIMSADMISRIETGGTGVTFPTIEKLARALEVDPCELFIHDPTLGSDRRPVLLDLASRLAKLDDDDLRWAADLLDTALRSKPRSVRVSARRFEATGFEP
ncbi:helix-turn-helix domain-containing protein [Sphingomonas sp. LT1P40]|uniref:helix-turn-helix domain-containing protein n=1 Tax=Alteristakelama amylovorans TaxID=3096166 RepID=UPI002FC9F093